MRTSKSSYVYTPGWHIGSRKIGTAGYLWPLGCVSSRYVMKLKGYDLTMGCTGPFRDNGCSSASWCHQGLNRPLQRQPHARLMPSGSISASCYWCPLPNTLPGEAGLRLPSAWHLVDCIPTVPFSGECDPQEAQTTLQEAWEQGQTPIWSHTVSQVPQPDLNPALCGPQKQNHCLYVVPNSWPSSGYLANNINRRSRMCFSFRSLVLKNLQLYKDVM